MSCEQFSAVTGNRCMLPVLSDPCIRKTPLGRSYVGQTRKRTFSITPSKAFPRTWYSIYLATASLIQCASDSKAAVRGPSHWNWHVTKYPFHTETNSKEIKPVTTELKKVVEPTTIAYHCLFHILYDEISPWWGWQFTSFSRLIEWFLRVYTKQKYSSRVREVFDYEEKERRMTI